MKGTFELTTATVRNDVNRGYSAIVPQACVCYSAPVPQVQILSSVTFELITAMGRVDVSKGKMKPWFELAAAIVEDDAIHVRDEVKALKEDRYSAAAPKWAEMQHGDIDGTCEGTGRSRCFSSAWPRARILLRHSHRTVTWKVGQSRRFPQKISKDEKKAGQSRRFLQKGSKSKAVIPRVRATESSNLKINIKRGKIAALRRSPGTG